MSNDEDILEGFDFDSRDKGFVSDDDFGLLNDTVEASSQSQQQTEMNTGQSGNEVKPKEGVGTVQDKVKSSNSMNTSQNRVRVPQGNSQPHQSKGSTNQQRGTSQSVTSQRPVQSQSKTASNNQPVQQFSQRTDRMRIKSQQKVNPNQKRGTNVPITQTQSQVSPKQQRRQATVEIPNNQQVLLEDNTPRKKKSKIPLILALLVIVGGIIGFVVYKNNKLIPVEEDYQKSGRYAYDTLMTSLNTYDAEVVDKVVGQIDGDSYLAQEWSYANNNKVRQDFIKMVCSYVKFEYPQVPQLSTTGKEMKDKSGNPLLVVSSMNNGESVSVSHIDYNGVSAMMQEDKEAILNLYKSSDISTEDYEYEDEMVDLMLNYILSKSNLPVKSSNITMQVALYGTPIIVDDTELDKLLFSSDEFHNMCDIFSQVATGFTGHAVEKYTVQEEQPNPEYSQWKIRFDAYYEESGGKFIKGVSRWEPWYLRDENNNFILDENGEKIVNYYSIKDENGNDWIQPSETVIVDVEKEKQVDVTWVKDSIIPYCFLGAYYCQNEYSGTFSPDVRIGDGTIENPAGVGTPIITKCLGTDGKYHDIKVTLTGYWTGKDAIDYAVSFSERNRGLDINSVIQLICYEVKIENLEKSDFTFKSDMFLADKNSNKSTRTGTMYGFLDKATVKAGESVIINDWATSTELAQKYVCWGSSFNREFSTIYFKVLAGEGNVPTYSAYKAFTGESGVNNNSNTERQTESVSQAQ